MSDLIQQLTDLISDESKWRKGGRPYQVKGPWALDTGIYKLWSDQNGKRYLNDYIGKAIQEYIECTPKYNWGIRFMALRPFHPYIIDFNDHKNTTFKDIQNVLAIAARIRKDDLERRDSIEAKRILEGYGYKW